MVSVPEGANRTVRPVPKPSNDKAFAYVWNCCAATEQAACILLATDDDGPGRALAEELARRLGIYLYLVLPLYLMSCLNLITPLYLISPQFFGITSAPDFTSVPDSRLHIRNLLLLAWRGHSCSSTYSLLLQMFGGKELLFIQN